MLPAANRLTTAADFRAAVRDGRRAGSRTVVVHLRDPAGDGAGDEGGRTGSRVGFVVSKAVGNAVVRNRVKRRLRHLMRERVGLLQGGSIVVVRALPAAGDASYERLGHDLERSLDRSLQRSPEPAVGR